MIKSFFNPVYWMGSVWLSGWIASRGIPDVGMWRTVFLVVGILHLIMLARRSMSPITWPRFNVEVAVLVVLTLWLLLQSAFISSTPSASLAELGDEWGKWLLTVVIAIWMVLKVFSSEGRANWLIVGLFFGCFIHVISTVAYQIWSYFYSGNLMLGNSFLGNYGYASPFVTGALSFLMAEVVLRFNDKQWLPFSNQWLVFIFFSTLVALGVLNAKAAVVGSVVLFLASAIFVVISLKSMRQGVLLFAGAVFVLIVSVTWNNRWHGTSDSIVAVINSPIDFQTFTGASDPSAMVNQMEASSYLRAMWVKISLNGIAKHPFGLGYGSDAFGRFVVELGGPKGVVSSHSGWLDFALANGIIGLGLLLLLFLLIMRRGWLSYQIGDATGLVLLFFVLNFCVRSLLDGHMYGSRFIGFAFVTAILWGLAVVSQENNRGV
ncbi:MAG: O-antigen ligase family protein [Thiothrix sp.]|uniref:O-antigen ligase family protein n=1 Tax=Thiothrix sp. TaxID=1032 RepID=UPI0026073371|nr:O-antigen ligase family protein [Thiothrix sp.]MDD5394640.1 O-antigen ligase family protein [Thiothrix sp.]